MADTETVMKRLPEIAAYLRRESDKHDSIARVILGGWANDIDAALALIREPQRPRARGRVERFYVCGECGAEIGKGDAFCRMCGREARWDG